MDSESLTDDEFMTLPYLICEQCNNATIDYHYDYSSRLNLMRKQYHTLFNPWMVTKLCECQNKRTMGNFELPESKVTKVTKETKKSKKN